MFGKSLNTAVNTVVNTVQDKNTIDKIMFSASKFESIITELEEVFRQYKIQKAPYVSAPDDHIKSHCMFFETHKVMTDFLCDIKYNGADVVGFRIKEGKFVTREISQLYATPEMELIVLDHLERAINVYAKATNATISDRAVEIQKLYLEVVKRRELNSERNSSVFCYIK